MQRAGSSSEKRALLTPDSPPGVSGCDPEGRCALVIRAGGHRGLCRFVRAERSRSTAGTRRSLRRQSPRDVEDSRIRDRHARTCGDGCLGLLSEGDVHPPRQRRRIRSPPQRHRRRHAQSRRAGTHGRASAGNLAAATACRGRLHGLRAQHAHDRARRPSFQFELVQRPTSVAAFIARRPREVRAAFGRPRLSGANAARQASPARPARPVPQARQVRRALAGRTAVPRPMHTSRRMAPSTPRARSTSRVPSLRTSASASACRSRQRTSSRASKATKTACSSRKWASFSPDSAPSRVARQDPTPGSRSRNTEIR